ncbi:MAG TPA: response regulator transcription factor [Chitinophagaceae bacterium]|nr:response regulator transcription factor [Chitinophagaceae bacterium]
MQPITLSIVEDLDEVREGLSQYLSSSDEFLILATFQNAEDAATKLPEIQPDIVIMDINLPGMDGISCISEVKRKSPRIQFMMFTIYETDEKVFEALKAGASGYLLKKSSFDVIANALKELNAGGSPMSAHIARKLVNVFHQQKNEMDVLSSRENEIIHLLAQGLLYKEIADKLSITTGTVSQHIHNIYEKLHVQNRTEAINKFLGRKKP